MMDGRERGRPTSNEMYLKFEIPIYFINNYCVLTVTSSNGWLDDLIMRPYCVYSCLLYTSPSPRDKRQSRMPSSA